MKLVYTLHRPAKWCNGAKVKWLVLACVLSTLLYICIDLRDFTVICQIMSSSRVGCVTRSLTKQPPLVSKVFKIQMRTLCVHDSLIPGLLYGAGALSVFQAVV